MCVGFTFNTPSDIQAVVIDSTCRVNSTATGIPANTVKLPAPFNVTAQSKQSIVATAAGSTTVTVGTVWLDLKPAAQITGYTVTFPPTPCDGQSFTLSTRQNILNLTCAGNGNTVLNPPTNLLAATSCKWMYDLSTTSWVRYD